VNGDLQDYKPSEAEPNEASAEHWSKAYY